MFGRPMRTDSKKNAPSWMNEIASEVCPGLIIHWFPSKEYCYGCANVQGLRSIELHTPDDGGSTPSAIMVLLHEIAHVLAPHKSSNVQNIRSGYHGIRFWTKAAALYRRWGLLEYASRKDGYKCGRDWLAGLHSRLHPWLHGSEEDRTEKEVYTTPDGGVWQLDHRRGEALMISRKATFEYRHVMSNNGVGKIVKIRLTSKKS